MEILGLSDMTWISMIACIACLGFGLYMVKTGKPGFVRSINDNARYKDKKQYALRGGRLLLYLSGACLVMTGLSFVSPVISNIIGIVSICVFGFFWKKMSDEYGPV
ncbi:MAG: hypothetical protein K6E98_11990 [Lachnospiraceae bacterium]|nr:hypothetical protein [Lachnospiraceae bacterium]